MRPLLRSRITQFRFLAKGISELLAEESRFFAPELQIQADVGSLVSMFWQGYLSQRARMGELTEAPHFLLTGTALDLLNGAGQEELWG